VLQRLGVVQSQIFHVEHGQPSRLQYVHHFSQGGRVGAGKNALLDPGIQRPGTIRANGMDKAATLLAKTAIDHHPEFLVMTSPDMFKHADGYENIIIAAHGPVVGLDEGHPIFQPLSPRLLPCICDLLAGNIVGTHLNPILTRHVQRQHTPAATGFDHPLTGLQPEFATDMIHLRHLRLHQLGGWLGKICAGVEQLSIQPQTKELIAKVIVVVNVRR